MNNIKTIYVLIGIPGAGKTYYREKNLSTLNYISCDELREKHFGLERSFEIRQEVSKIIKENLVAMSLETQDFVVDSTYFNKKEERKFLFENFQNFNIIGVYLDTPLKKAISQNNLREEHRRILEKMIEKFYNELEPPSEEENFFDILEILK